MRKRIISLLLSLTMIISMMPIFTTTASAATTHNPYHKDGNLCYMLPYAHNAMLWSSPEYYITHYNIKHVYNYANLKKSFDRGIPQTLANALDNTPNSIITVANELFNFDGEFTEQDFYDYLLTSMLIGNAVSEAQSVDVDDANTIKEILNMSVDGIEVSNGVVFSGKLIDLLKKFDFSNAATATNTLKSINEKSANVYSKLTAKLPNGSFGSFFTVLSCILQTIEELDEAYQLCAAYEIIYENLGDDAGLVLQYMELSTSDPLLKASISKYERIVNSDDYWTAVVATGLIEGLNVAEEITMNILTTVGRSLITAQLVAASSVWGAFFIGYTIADLLLGISDYVEYINEITRYNIIDNTLLITIASLENICTNNENTKDSVKYCDAYIFAMKMAWRLQTEELEKCKEFFEKGQKKGWFGDYFKDEENLEQWNNSINYCINAVANVKPTAFVNNALDQYSRDLDLIIAGYKITYDSNGGTEIPSGTKKYNEPYSLTNTVPTKDGYTFTVWQSGGNTYYSSGYELEASLNPCWCSRELIFTAQWAETQDTITYNANGGTGAPVSHENTDGPTTISTTVPTRTGFTFLGWAESATATTATYQPGDTLTKEGSVTLYAVWQAGTFDIVFHANGGVYADNSDSKTMQKTYLQNFTVNPEIPTRDGYVFSGYWTLNADGSGTQYTQGKTYSDIGGAGLSAKHLYAHWTKVKTEVTFRYDYTNCTYTDITIPLTNGSASITLIDPPAEKIAEIGKEFVQWKYYYPDGSGYKYYQTGDTIILTDDMTLYAEWADPAGDTLLSVFTDKTSYMPGDTVKINITADNSGYFTVDASNNTGFTIQNAEGGKTATGVFVENSSESTSTNLKCYDNGSVYTVMLYIPNNCSDGAYTVDIVASNGTYGVSDTETSTASETITITVDTSEEEVASYVLSYNLNGGYGTIPDSEYFEEDDHVELADDSGFQRDGYEFGGWSKNSDGSGKTYKAGRDYQFTESTQLYAIWEPVAADADELSLALGVERYSKVYKPGETAHIIVSPDNSDHFFIDVSDCAGFTVLSAMGTKLTEATYIEYSSPAFISGRDGYTDGSNKYIPVYIPSNCKDGQYTFFVTATDGILDQTSGETIKCSVTIYVRESDIPDSIQLSKSEITLHVGDEKRLKATVEPQYIFNEYNEKEVTWSTSNKNVASIDDKGNSVDISGVKSGTATITATVDGISASCTVTVVRCDHSLKIVEPEYLASAATCEKQAEYYYVCSCGDVGSATYKVGELADHNYSGWTVIQEATETTAGVEQRVCSGCGATEERSIPATSAHTTHTPGTAWYSDAEKHWHICSVDGCTVKLNEDTHDFGELSVETPATETNTGIGYRTCELCGYTKSEVIPVLEPTLYTVTVTNGSGDGEYAAGATVLITADAPESGKQFKEWVGLDGVNIISGSINTATVVFTMPENAVNASATYEDIPVDATYSVTVQTDGNGTASATPASATVGTKITLNATANNGYHFKEWQVVSGDVTITNNQFTMPDSNVIIKAIFEEDVPVLPTTYSITVQTDGNGTASATPASATAGAEITLSATANSGYHFKEWQVISGDVTITNNKFVMPDGDVTVKAIFEEDAPVVPTTYTITIINGAANKATAVEGETVTITADAPEAGKRFKEWTTEDGVAFADANASTTTFTMLGKNVTVTATYEDIPVTKYSVTVTNGSGSGDYAEGASVTITADAAPAGKQFKEWTGADGLTFTSGSKTSATATFTMPAGDVNVTATYEDVPVVKYDVTVNGSCASTTGAGEYEVGETVTISAGTRSGYTFAGWTSSDVTINNKYSNTATFTMPAKHVTVTANWTKDSGGIVIPTVFPVTVKDSDNGEVTASSKYVAPGTTVKLTVTPEEGYELDTLTVKCGSKEVQTTLKNGKYQFTMPYAGVTVTATFKKIETPVVPDPVVPSFDDVAEDTYYFDAVEWAVENGITTGTSDTTFSPDMTSTRAQAVTFLWRAAGSPEPKSNVMPFEDVAAEAYYYKAVLWAVENGITNGTSATTFSPDADCTRAQIVTFLWRSQKSPAITAVNPFADVAAEAYYYDAVLWAVDEKITNGTSETAFSPDADCTRAQIVTFLYRCLGDK